MKLSTLGRKAAKFADTFPKGRVSLHPLQNYDKRPMNLFRDFYPKGIPKARKEGIRFLLQCCDERRSVVKHVVDLHFINVANYKSAEGAYEDLMDTRFDYGNGGATIRRYHGHMLAFFCREFNKAHNKKKSKVVAPVTGE